MAGRRKSPPPCPSSARRTRRTSPDTRFRSMVGSLLLVSLTSDGSASAATPPDFEDFHCPPLRCRAAVEQPCESRVDSGFVPGVEGLGLEDRREHIGHVAKIIHEPVVGDPVAALSSG